MKILVIDDEIGIQEMIKSHFGLRGHEVYGAGDGAEGIELAKKIQPDVILLDIKMKNMDGDKALPELRQLTPKAKYLLCQPIRTG